MGLSESIGGFYSGIEEKFYAAMDFLSDKGVPVYSLIDPLEERGIPAFPVALALLFVLAFLAYGFAFLSSPGTTVTLSLTDNSGATLSGVNISVTDAKTGQQIDVGSNVATDGQQVKVPRGIGAQIAISASKDGYQQQVVPVTISSSAVDASIVLKKNVVQIEGTVRLEDAAGNGVEGATVNATLSATSQVQCDEKGKGEYTCIGVPDGGKAQLTITHPNYEQKNMDATFSKDVPVQVQLTAKAIALQGAGNLIVRAFDADTKERLSGFTVQVYDAKDNGLISESTESDGSGEQDLKVQNGTSARLVVKKDGYISYNSGDVGENFTVLPPEVKREVYLRKGTNAITVGVLDATGRPLPSIGVNLMSEAGELLGTKETSIAGEAVFQGLDAQKTYYVSAWQDQYLPAIQKVVLSESNRASLVLLAVTAANSGSLTVYTADDAGKPLIDVALSFMQDDGNGNTIPLGVPTQKTDTTGKFVLLAPLNANITVKASKGNLEGQGSAKVLETFKNEIFMTMREPFSQVSVKVLDKDGKEATSGYISITGGKDVLVEGAYAPGLTFNPKGNEYVDVSYSDAAGNAFEEQVYVKDVNAITVSPKGASSSGTAPDAEFVGVYNIDGSKALGLAKGTDYFLQFRVVYSAGTTQNGFHVRLGDDSVNFVDSQDAGITGFSATGAGSFYGRSYSPVPAPGFEALDFQNSGSEGKYNKWLELYFQSAGEKIIKVRVKAKETAATGDIEVHYRAWSTIGNSIYRTPVDEELKLSQFTANKTALYAETKVEKVGILEAGTQCQNALCASYRFVGSDGTVYPADNFKAVLGNLYALEVTISPTTASGVTIKASTSKQSPKIGFQGFAIDSSAPFPDNNSEDTGLQVDNVTVQQGQPSTVRLFFKALRTDNSQLTLQLISGGTVINEQFYFNVYREKAILLKTSPETVLFGQDFAVMLQDPDRNPVENAQIVLSDAGGQHLLTLTGTGSSNNGLGGKYLVKNTFSAGTIKYSVSADGYKSLDGTIEVTKSGMLKFSADSTYLAIQKSVKSAEQFIDLANTSSQGVQDITFEVHPITPLPDGMDIKVTPFSSLPQGASQRITVVGEYSGGLDTAHGEAMLVARGRTEAGFTVTSQTKVVVDYNPTVPQDCLELSKDRIVVYVASGLEDRGYYDGQFNANNAANPGFYNNYYNNNYNGSSYNSNPDQYNSLNNNNLSPNNPNYAYSPYSRYNGYSTTSSDTFTAKLADRPECQVQLELTAQSVSEGGNVVNGLDVQAGNIRLLPQQPGVQQAAGRTDNQQVTVTVTNNLVRNYADKQRFGYQLVYKGQGFEKSVPVDVYIWNPAYALDVTRNVEMYLGPNDTGTYAAQVPLFVRNIGQADIQNVDFRVSTTTSRGNIDVQIIPPYAIQFLRQGDEVFPPKTLVAQVMRNEKSTINEVKELDITGSINGQTYSFGPVMINAHVSAAQCLIVTPGNIVYYSTRSDASIAKQITVRNACAEEVRIVDIAKPQLGRSTLGLEPLGTVLPPGTQVNLNLVLNAGESMDLATQAVRLKAFLLRSGAPIDSNPILVDFKIGKSALAGEAASEPVTLKVCEGGPDKTVRFPKIASGTNPLCDNSYCDAEQLSNYLAARIDEAVSDAQKQVTNRSAELQKTDCDQIDLANGYCKFSDLGVKLKPISVYMSNDNISALLLEHAIKQKQGAVKNFHVEFTQGNNTGQYLGGYSRQIYMNNNFRGCGAYTVSFDGFVRVEGTRLVPELMNVVVDVASETQGGGARQLTDQCLPKIENINNFLPVDRSLSPSLKLDTWLGVVEAKDKALESVSSDVAKTIFGSDKRALTGATGSNLLAMSLGSGQDYLVRLEMPNTNADNPVTVNAYIREAVGVNKQTGEETLQAQLAKEAGQAISNLRNNSVEGCIGQDESYIKLMSAKGNFGQLNLDIRGAVPVQYNTPACLDFNVTSDIKETVSVSTRQVVALDGITADSPFLRQAPQQSTAAGTAQVQDNGARPQSIDIDVSKLDKASNRFSGNGQLCVIGSSQLQQAQGRKISIDAKRKVGTGKWGPQDVPLAVCGIHPLKFIGKTRQESFTATKPGEYYYATFIWKGAPDKLLLSDFTKLGDVTDMVDKADQVIDGKRAITKEDTPEVVSAKKTAGAYFLGACVVASAGTSLLRPTVVGNIPLMILTALSDCVPSYVSLMGDVYPWAKAINDFVGSVLDKAWGVISWPLKAALGTVGINVNKAQQQVVDASKTGAIIDIGKGMALGSVIKDSLVSYNNLSDTTKFEDSTLRFKNLSKARVVAENVADDLVTKLAKEGYGIQVSVSPTGARVYTRGGVALAPGSPEADFLDNFWNTFVDNADKEVLNQGVGQATIRGRALSLEEEKKALQSTLDKTGTDTTILEKWAKSRGGINTTTVNSFIDKDAISKDILDDIDTISKNVLTEDVAGPQKVTDAALAGEKSAFENDTVKNLKAQMIDEYARKVGISNVRPAGGAPSPAEALVGTRLDDVKLSASTLEGSIQETVNTVDVGAVTDTVTKNISNDLTNEVSGAIKKETGISQDTVQKIIDKYRETLRNNINQRASDRLTIDPSKVIPASKSDLRATAIDMIATNKGITPATADGLFGANLDTVLSSTSDLRDLEAKTTEFLHTYGGFSISDAQDLLDVRLRVSGAKNIIYEEVDRFRNSIVDELKRTGQITTDAQESTVRKELETLTQNITTKDTGTITEELTNLAGRRTTTTTGTTKTFNKLSISKAREDSAVRQMKDRLSALTKEAIDNPGSHPELDKYVGKVFQKKGMPQLISNMKGKVEPKGAIPSFFSGQGQKLFWKNLLKEGSFSLLSNYIGYTLYDQVLSSKLKAINHKPDMKTRAQEAQEAGIAFASVIYTAEGDTSGYILKYRTYRVSVANLNDGRKSIKLALTDGIPNGTKKEMVLNDCTNPGFDEEVGAVLPGLFPQVEPETKMPKLFQNSDVLKSLHVKIVRNYLAPQPTGERYGSLITAATEDPALSGQQSSLGQTFFTQTGLQLQPLVVSIGIVKSQLGNDPKFKSDYMFGCSFGDTSKKDVYNNARCAAEKLVKYIPACKDAPVNKAACFLNKYNDDKTTPRNQKSNADMMNVTDEQFQNIYDTWASQDYKWKAS